MTENPFQLPGYQVIGMQDTGVAFDVHLQPPSPVACSSCGTIGDFSASNVSLVARHSDQSYLGFIPMPR